MLTAFSFLPDLSVHLLTARKKCVKEPLPFSEAMVLQSLLYWRRRFWRRVECFSRNSFSFLLYPYLRHITGMSTEYLCAAS